MYTEPIENEDEFDGRAEYRLGAAMIAYSAIMYILLTYYPGKLSAVMEHEPGGGIGGRVIEIFIRHIEIVVSMGTPLLRIIAVIGVVVIAYGVMLSSGTRLRLGPKTERDRDGPGRRGRQ